MDFSNRKRVRVDWHDYNRGYYFVTICVQDKEHAFGEIFDGSMHLTHLGEIVKQHIESLPSHWCQVSVIESVVMPNHVHMLLLIDGHMVEKNHEKVVQMGGFRSFLATVVGGFKAGVKRYANQHGVSFQWQAGYHEHIVRDQHGFDNILRYIIENVQSWDTDNYRM